MTWNRRVRAIGLALVCAAIASAPAQAGTVTTSNACLYSFNDEYRNQPVTLSGVGSPVGAPAGTPATLSGASLSATLPTALPQQGYELGIFTAGDNEVPLRVWVAIASSNAAPATQVRELNVVATTRIVVDSGGEFVSGTPIVVTIPIPDTTWTVAANGPVSFSQAGPGTLPSLPVGVDDKLAPVTGSIVVKPKLANLRFVLDCQPGTTALPYKTFTPALASPFATLEAAQPVPPPSPAKKRTSPKPRLASTKARLLAGRVALVVACPAGGASCKGRLAMRSFAPLRIGSKRARAAITSGGAYTVPAGARRTVRTAVLPTIRRLMRTRKTLRVRVTLDPSSGANVNKTLTLSR